MTSLLSVIEMPDVTRRPRISAESTSRSIGLRSSEQPSYLSSRFHGKSSAWCKCRCGCRIGRESSARDFLSTPARSGTSAPLVRTYLCGTRVSLTRKMRGGRNASHLPSRFCGAYRREGFQAHPMLLDGSSSQSPTLRGEPARAVSPQPARVHERLPRTLLPIHSSARSPRSTRRR